MTSAGSSNNSSSGASGGAGGNSGPDPRQRRQSLFACVDRCTRPLESLTSDARSAVQQAAACLQQCGAEFDRTDWTVRVPDDADTEATGLLTAMERQLRDAHRRLSVAWSVSGDDVRQWGGDAARKSVVLATGSALDASELAVAEALARNRPYPQEIDTVVSAGIVRIRVRTQVPAGPAQPQAAGGSKG